MADDKDKDVPPAPVAADGTAPADATASAAAPMPDASGPPTKLTPPDASEATDGMAQAAPTEETPPTTASDASDTPPAPATAATQDKPATDNPDAAQQADATPAPAPAPAPAAPPVALKGGANPKTAAVASAGAFVLQFGAFSVETNAQKLADQLKQKGHDVTVVVAQDAKGRQLFAVRGGSYPNAGEAEIAARRIHNDEQLPIVVVRQQHTPGPA
jgi:cell division protein FtsN